MRLVHLSDTHLGFSAYSKLDPVEGINQREADIYRAFGQAVDKVLQLQPDLVIHSGDLFDRPHPQNRAIDFAMRQLIRLSEAGIDTVLISGNHSTPRLREYGNIFSVFEHLEHVHPIHRPGRTSLVIGDVTIHGVPHSAVPPLADVMERIAPSRETGMNILVLHAGIVGPETYKMDEFNEQTVSGESISGDWDYVALGHYHEFKKVGRAAYYAGSTERMSFREWNQDKGIVEVDLDSNKIAFHKLEIREMLDLPVIDASGLASPEILREAKDRLNSTGIDNKITRLVVKNVATEAYRSLDMSTMKRFGSGALHFELRIERSGAEATATAGDVHIGLLADEFSKYVLSLDASDDKKKKLLDLGVPYVARVEE